MRCANPQCGDRSRGLMYAADGVHLCLHCAELTRNHRHVQLDEFVQIDPPYQKEIGRLRQTIQEARGHYDYLREQGCELVRG